MFARRQSSIPYALKHNRRYLDFNHLSRKIKEETARATFRSGAHSLTRSKNAFEARNLCLRERSLRV